MGYVSYEVVEELFFERVEVIKGDVPANRENWSYFLDDLHRAGMITEDDVNNWSYPSHESFEYYGKAY